MPRGFSALKWYGLRLVLNYQRNLYSKKKLSTKSYISSILLIWRWEKKWGSYIRCEENFGNHRVAREREIFEHGHGTIFLRTNKELGTRGQMTYRSVSDRIQVDAVSPITTLGRRKSWATHGMLLVRVTNNWQHGAWSYSVYTITCTVYDNSQLVEQSVRSCTTFQWLIVKRKMCVQRWWIISSELAIAVAVV
jgi:hypothetical protein